MRVLLVDDHSLIRSGLRDSLSQQYESATIAEAETGKAALNLAIDQPFDLALIDLFLPGEKLFKLVKDLCAYNPDLPVIVLSSSEQPAHIRRSIDLGAVGYVSKSAPQASLFAAIDVVMAGGTYFPPQPSTPASTPVSASTPKTETVDPLSLSFQEVSGLLTARQIEILALMAEGRPNKEIASHLGLSTDTVKVHVSAVLKNLGLSNRTQAAILGEKLGLTAAPDPERSDSEPPT